MQGSAWRWSGRCRSPPRVPWWSVWVQIPESAVPCTGLRAHRPRRGLPHTAPSPLGRPAAASRNSREAIEVSCLSTYMHIHLLSSTKIACAGCARPESRDARCCAAARRSELHMQAQGPYGHGSAIAVVGGIPDILVVGGQLRPRKQSDAVVSLDHLFRTGVRELAVALQDAEAAEIQILLALRGDAVVQEYDPEGIAGPIPMRPFEGSADLDGAVDVRELEDLDVALRLPHAGEQAEVIGHRLLEVEASADAAAVLA